MHRSLTIVALALAGLFTTTAVADTLTVCASGCQYVSINAAIDAASDGDVILLAAETYLEGEPIDLGGKQITLRGAVDKSGGPATILDGASTHTVLVAESGETTATVLENLVVQNGLASMWSVDDVNYYNYGFASGGGLFMYPQALDSDGLFDDATGLTLRNSTFQANVCAKPSGNNREGNGGGAFLGEYSQLVLDGCTFLGNTSERSGAAIYCLKFCALDLDACLFESNKAGNNAAIILDEYGAATIDDCTFRSNGSDSYGGAFFIQDYSTVDFANCEFDGNGGAYTTADGEGDDGEVWDTNDGGAFYMQDYSTVTVTSSTFTDNVTNREGGAIKMEDRASLTLIDCDFTGNQTGGSGGAILNWRALLNASNCTFTDNEVTSARYSSSGGGAIQMRLDDSTNSAGQFNGLVLTDCTFEGNKVSLSTDPDAPPSVSVTAGGAIIILDDDDLDPVPEYDINGCVFLDNVADSGGAIFIRYPDTVDFAGSGNLACGNQPDHFNATPPNLFFDCLADDCTDCTDTDDDGVPDFLDVCPGGDDTADADSDGTPDFCDGCPNDPLKTAPGDCGCGVVESAVEGDRDCDGDYDAEDVRLAMAEVGITEGTPGDMDGDDDVDAADFVAVRDQIGVDALGCLVADINGDGEVDGADFAYVLGYWGLCSAP